MARTPSISTRSAVELPVTRAVGKPTAWLAREWMVGWSFDSTYSASGTISGKML